MKYIAHRVNTARELENIPVECGVELDLRDRGNELILSHDPFLDGELFEDYLKNYRHGLMILNIKSERIEYRVLELMEKYGVKEYFFLDSSFPMIYSLAAQGKTKFALRFSEFEGVDTLMNMRGKAEWAWVDCFTKLPLDRESYRLLKEAGYKLCLVSPELQGRPEDLEGMADRINSLGIKFDAVCSKIYNYDFWQAKLGFWKCHG